MRKALLGALFGLLVGSVLGGLLAFTVHCMEQNDQPEKGWRSYPNLSDNTGSAPLLWQHVRGSLPLSYLLFQGILLGGGFGSVVGTISGAIGAIIRTVGKTRSG